MRAWSTIPTHIAIIEILSKKGALTDTELYKEVKKVISDLSFRELNRAMLRLEVAGFIKVSRLMKEKRRVELKEAGSVR